MSDRPQEATSFNAPCAVCQAPRRVHTGGDMRCPGRSTGSYTRTSSQPAQPHRASTSFADDELAAGVAVLLMLRRGADPKVVMRSDSFRRFSQKIEGMHNRIERRRDGGAKGDNHG